MNNKVEEYQDKNLKIEYTRSSGIRSVISKIKTFKSFKIRDFRIYYGAMAGQWAVQSMLMMANALLAYRLTGSGTIIGLVSLAQGIPQILIALLGGAVADRVQKKYILLFCQIALAFVALAFAIAFTMGFVTPESWWLLLVLGFSEGILLGFLQPASFSIIPEIVGGEELMNAISLSSMGQTFFRLFAPSLAGFLIDAYGFAIIYYLMFGLYTIGCILVTFIPITKPSVTDQAVSVRSTLADMYEGLCYLRREGTIMLIVVFGLAHIICGMPFMILMSMFTEDILNVGAMGLGILNSVLSVGSLIGALVMASLPNRKRGILLLMSGVIMGVAVIVFAWSRSWYLSLAMMPFTGISMTMHMTMTATLIQYYVNPDYRGRMQSFVTMSSGLACFGSFLAGALSEIMGVQLAVGGMAILLTVVSLFFMIFFKELASLE